MSDKRDQIKFIMLRYDNYINGVNTKGNFLLAFNIFLSGAIITNYNTILTKIGSQNAIIAFKILLALFLVVVLYAIISIFKAVYPFLKSGNSTIQGYHSLIFFNSVAEFPNDSSFQTKFDGQSDPDLLNDLIAQSYQLAKGLERKFKLIRNAMIAIYIELSLLVIIFLFLLIF